MGSGSGAFVIALIVFLVVGARTCKPVRERPRECSGFCARLLDLNVLTRCIILGPMSAKRTSTTRRTTRPRPTSRGAGRRDVMTTQGNTQGSGVKDMFGKDPFGDVRAKAIEAWMACSEANQRVLGEFVGLSSTAAKETVRMYGEIGAATIEAVRSMPVSPMPSSSSIEELTKDPFAGPRQRMLTAGEAPQHLFRLFDSNTRIVGQGVQRLQE